jgi:hypothetical protein
MIEEMTSNLVSPFKLALSMKQWPWGKAVPKHSMSAGIISSLLIRTTSPTRISPEATPIN